jgi:hypothetical protein
MYSPLFINNYNILTTINQQQWEYDDDLVGGDWNHGIWIDFPVSWECHNPN